MCIRDSYPHFLKPDDVFKWATPGRAYAAQIVRGPSGKFYLCLLYTSDAADERSSVDLGGRRIIKKKNEIDIRRSQRITQIIEN